MEERTEPGLPASLVNGRLEGLSVPDLLWNLCRRRSTGVLHLTNLGITKKVYIDQGRIVFALSGDPDDRLGDLLLREGQITLDQLEAAIAQLSSGKRLGALLVAAGHLSPDNLVRGILSQVKGIVLALFPWDEGEYAFVEGPLPTDEVITLGMRTAEILLQGIRQIRSFTRIRKSVGPPTTRFRLVSSWHEVVDGLDIRDGERMLLRRLEEAGVRGASIDAMCREVFLSNFEIYQALWAFLVLGIVEAASSADQAATDAAIEGRLERTSLPEVLVRLCRDELTGVLHLMQGTRERTLHIKAGVCVFATSNDVDDGLVAHLLRRGVISLGDREETARRLLSNKRVGTILLEMGVIDEGDLQATVREQLAEIVFDTFRWSEGEFRFREGELPTVEEITLNRSVEDLIFAGVRRVTSWPRVRHGCGGLGARLVLLPRYLSVLDKMTVGPEEWELISLLKTPKTVLEVCRESMLGDFRSCQILWALRLLDGVGEAPLEVSVDTAIGAFDIVSASEPAVASSASSPAEIPVVASVEVTANETPAPVDDDRSEAPRGPDPDPVPIPLSDADNAAEVISEPWRLAAFTRPAPEAAPAPEPAPEPAAAMAEPEMATVDEDRANATIAISRESVEAAIRGPEPEPSRFELAEPGTGVDDMQVDDTKIDMPPDVSRVFELDDAVASGSSVPSAEASVETPVTGSDVAEPALEAIDPDRTARVSREEVESALRQPAAAPEPASPPFAPPDDLDGAVASFNARHVILFRSLRAEIGAGAANFVRSCRAGLDDGFAAMFESADLRADGSWDPEGLKRSVIEHRVSNASEGFRRLLDDELRRLRAHLGEARAAALADQLSTIP